MSTIPMHLPQKQETLARPLKQDHHCAQGFGGGDTAVGGGQTGGDQYTDNTDAPRTQQKDSTYGGDQTDLNAGGDTNYGVHSPLQTCQQLAAHVPQ